MRLHLYTYVTLYYEYTRRSYLYKRLYQTDFEISCPIPNHPIAKSCVGHVFCTLIYSYNFHQAMIIAPPDSTSTGHTHEQVPADPRDPGIGIGIIMPPKDPGGDPGSGARHGLCGWPGGGGGARPVPDGAAPGIVMKGFGAGVATTGAGGGGGGCCCGAPEGESAGGGGAARLAVALGAATGGGGGGACTCGGKAGPRFVWLPLYTEIPRSRAVTKFCTPWLANGDASAGTRLAIICAS